MVEKRFELVFSLFSHPVFGVFIEPFLVQLLENGGMSLTFQKVASANVEDFFPQVTAHQKKLITICQRLSNQQLAKEFNVIPVHLETQIQKVSEAKDTKSKSLMEHIRGRLSKAKEEFFALINGSELLYETRKDGYPAGVKISYNPDVTFKLEYFFKEDSLTIRPFFSDQSLRGLPVQVLDESTPIILVGQHLVRLPSTIKPSRLKAFGTKQSIDVQAKFLSEYVRKILIPDLHGGFADIKGNVSIERVPLAATDLYFSFEFEGAQLGIFESKAADFKLPPFLSIDINWYYGKLKASFLKQGSNWVFVESEKPVFQLLERDERAEQEIQTKIENLFQIRFQKGQAKVTFAHLRDQILQNLDHLDKEITPRFSPEFNQLTLKKSKFNLKVFEKIDYFAIEGTIDWDGEEMDLYKLKSQFNLQQGWLKIGDKFAPLEEEDQLFLSQLMVMSSGNKELSISKTTARSIMENNSGLFSENWTRITTLLTKPKEEVNTDIASLSPNYPLREYQVKGVEWFIHLYVNKLGGILADDMGLGKTFQTAAFLRFIHSRSEKPAGCSLIVLPSTLIFNWQHELARFSKDFKVYSHSGPNRTSDLKSIAGWFNVILVSFQTLVRDISMFSKVEFKTLIIDEAHNLKNPSTVAYKAVSGLKAELTYLLTGTPLQNSPADLWALSELCNPGLLSQKIKPGSLTKNENMARFQQNLNLMQALIKPFLLRRTKENVLSELPEKTISTVYCTMTEEQEMEYLAYNQLVASELSDLSFGNSNARSVRILKALTALRLMANHPVLLDDAFTGSSGKFDLVKEKLEEVLAEGHKVLIFSSFVKHLNILAGFLKGRDIPFSMLTGKTQNRKEQVENFKQQDDRNVFLISLKAGGVGLNLVEANYVFLLDPWWNPAAESQAMDRVHRIGQKNKVIVYKFITSNTVEEKIILLQSQKTSMNDMMFEGADSEAPRFTIEALQEILTTKV